MGQINIKQQGKFLKWLTGDKYSGITIAPFGVYLKAKYYKALTESYAYGYENSLTNITLYEDYPVAFTIVNHEHIHWHQQLELGILPFYLWYVIEWFIKFITPPIGAYEDISFEREAYSHEGDQEYLSKRKLFAWFKYIW